MHTSGNGSLNNGTVYASATVVICELALTYGSVSFSGTTQQPVSNNLHAMHN